MNVRFCLIILLLGSVLQAQNFEWAASASRIFTGFHLSAVSNDGRLIAAGQYFQPDYNPMPGPTEFYDGSGGAVPFRVGNNQFFVVSYDSKGQIEWTLYGSDRFNGGTIHGLSVRSNGNTIVQFRSNYVPDCYRFIEPLSGKELNIDSLFPNPRSYESQANFSRFEYFAELSPKGSIEQITGVLLMSADEWSAFKVMNDDGYLLAYSSDVKAKDGQGRSRDVMHNFTLKLNKDFKQEWRQSAMYLDSSCCSVLEHRSGATVADDGSVLVFGSFRDGVRISGQSDFRLKDEPGSPKGLRYGSYIAKLSADGKLRWVRYSDGKSVISSVDIRNGRVYFGGEVLYSPRFFGSTVDTSGQKRAFLGCFSSSGELLWKQTFNAKNTQSVCSDEEGNVFISLRSQRRKGMEPLKVGSDTISDSYESVVVASFDGDGNYRWYRMSKARMSINTVSHLHTDWCGNLYFTGEMWYVLPVNMSVFDGAFVRGSGYGGAPIAAKIRTTIPDELITLNAALAQKFSFRRRDKMKKPSQTDDAKRFSSTNSLLNTIQQDSSLAANAGRGVVCTPIPFPWNIVAFPNPASGPVTVRMNTSYADPAVGLMLTDSKGALVRVLMPKQFKDAGQSDFNADLSGLSAGLYFIVMQGTASAATFPIVVQK